MFIKENTVCKTAVDIKFVSQQLKLKDLNVYTKR